MDIGRLLIVVILIAIIASLGAALFQMATGKGDSGKMLKALIWRIGLSVALFLLLLLAWRAGLIKPNGVK
ncbi:MAG TPA: twin transmembrane helix small protein [Steroidobacteraceae bacterium]|nr:twin transmembrane helix small protein [Steroidobacteraceae bacterium]